MKTIVLMLALISSPAPLVAGDALTQSLEQETSKGTVAERQAPTATPAPTSNPNAISDKAAEKKIRYHGKPSTKARRRVPAPSPTAVPHVPR